MINYLFFIAVFLVFCSTTIFGGYELRFFFPESDYKDYYIKAVRYDFEEPMFGINEMMIEGDDYNIVESWPTHGGFYSYIGFDFLSDQGTFSWPFIGEGKYEFQIYKDAFPDESWFEYNLVFKFKIDLRNGHSQESPDITFYYYGEANYISAENTIIEYAQEYKSWEILNTQADWEYFSNNVEITNAFVQNNNEAVNQDIITTLESKENGFPYLINDFNIGAQFSPGKNHYYWRGGEYGFSVNPNVQEYENANYKFRDWQN